MATGARKKKAPPKGEKLYHICRDRNDRFHFFVAEWSRHFLYSIRILCPRSPASPGEERRHAVFRISPLFSGPCSRVVGMK